MKILHVIASLAPRFGGPSKACFEMARAVAARGHEVSVFSTNMDGPDDLDVPTTEPQLRDGVTLRTFQVSRPRFWKPSWPMARALKQAIPKADVVHVHSLYLFHSLVAGILCAWSDTPYLVRPHGTLDPYLYRRHRLRKWVMELLFQNRVLKHAAAIHYTSEEEMRLAAPYVREAPGVVVPNGIDLVDYEAPPPAGTFRKMFPEIGERRIVLFLGRINFKKGLDILADAFVRLAAGRNDVHLVIAGPDDEGLGDKVKRTLNRGGVLSHTTFTGMLEGADKLAALNESALFVLPSYSENFGIAVVEAMACGLPVLISDRVNIWREVEDSGAGRVTPPDSTAFASAMDELLDDPMARRHMGEQGRRLVEERYRWDRIGDRLAAVYADIQAGRIPGGT
ncbi:MAG: glycosyltransferase [Alphaproteobacteria bacterium]|nr:glycosyltransferase [Alphaproteobacteria bacterium]